MNESNHVNLSKVTGWNISVFLFLIRALRDPKVSKQVKTDTEDSITTSRQKLAITVYAREF